MKMTKRCYYCRIKLKQKKANHATLRACRDQWEQFKETHPCVDCHLKNPNVIQADHVRGTKIMNCSEYVWWCTHGGAEGQRLELLKTEARCRFCHVIKSKGEWLALKRKSNATRNKSIFKAQPTRTAPGLPQPPATPAVVKLKKAALPVGVAGATGLALSGGEGPKKSEDPRRPDGSLPPYTPPRPPADPEPPKKAVAPPTDHNFMSSSSVYTGDNLKRPAKELTSAAKDFDRAFAAKRAELKKAGKDPSSGTFTWRGKQYNTKLKGE